MFRVFFGNVKELLYDFVTLQRFSVRVIGRVLFLRRLFSGFFELPTYLVNRDENLVPTNASNRSVFDSCVSASAVVSGLRELGCSDVLSLSDEFTIFLRSSFQESMYVRDEFESDISYSYEDVLNFDGAAKFVSVNQPDTSELHKYLCGRDIMMVAEGYLDSIAYCSARFTLIKYADNECQQLPRHVTGWHYDLDAHNFLKFFAYFDPNPKGSNSGDHRVLLGSHKKRYFWDFLFRRRLGFDAKRSADIRTLPFQNGKGFFEDTACYHRASGGSGVRGLAAFHYIN
jgi:hypothetical protein